MMHNNTREFFFSEALRYSKLITDKKEAADAIASGRKYPFTFTAGSDVPVSESHFDFIRGLLGRFPELTFVVNKSNKNIIEKIDTEYHSRIYFTDDSDAVYAVLVDFYNPFYISDTLGMLLNLNKSYIHSFPDINHDFILNLENTFKSYPNNREWMQERYGRYEVNTASDLLFLFYRDILPENEIIQMSKGYSDGFEEVYERIRLMREYPAFRQRDIDLIKRIMAPSQPHLEQEDYAKSFIHAVGLDM